MFDWQFHARIWAHFAHAYVCVVYEKRTYIESGQNGKRINFEFKMAKCAGLGIVEERYLSPFKQYLNHVYIFFFFRGSAGSGCCCCCIHSLLFIVLAIRGIFGVNAFWVGVHTLQTTHITIVTRLGGRNDVANCQFGRMVPMQPGGDAAAAAAALAAAEANWAGRMAPDRGSH